MLIYYTILLVVVLREVSADFTNPLTLRDIFIKEENLILALDKSELDNSGLLKAIEA